VIILSSVAEEAVDPVQVVAVLDWLNMQLEQQWQMDLTVLLSVMVVLAVLLVLIIQVLTEEPLLCLFHHPLHVVVEEVVLP
jgi:hypothetical protein